MAGSAPSRAELRLRAERLDPGAVLAVLIAPWPRAPIERARLSRRAAIRAAHLLRAARVRVEAARTARRLRKIGLTTRTVDIGPIVAGYQVGIGEARMRFPAEIAVLGSPAGTLPAPSALDQALADASRRAGAMRLETVRVLESGTMMAAVSQETAGERLLRLGDPIRDPALGGGLLKQLLSCRPPEVVRDRLVQPLARGNVDGLLWTLEERREGEHPWRLTPSIRDDCFQFLAALAAVSRPPGNGDRRLLADSIGGLMPLLEADERSRLGRIASRADATLASIPRGWGHGDFHPGNLLAARRRLVSVLDWDAASPAAVAGLDHLHLVATARPELRRLSHGRRCAGPLRRLIVTGVDQELERALLNAGVPAENEVRQALVDAYWLVRVARDVSTFADRASRPLWLGENLRDPLRAHPTAPGQ